MLLFRPLYLGFQKPGSISSIDYTRSVGLRSVVDLRNDVGQHSSCIKILHWRFSYCMRVFSCPVSHVSRVLTTATMPPVEPRSRISKGSSYEHMVTGSRFVLGRCRLTISMSDVRTTNIRMRGVLEENRVRYDTIIQQQCAPLNKKVDRFV